MVRVDFTDPAIEDLGSFDNSSIEAILAGIKKLEVEPHKRGIALSGNLRNLRRIVVGKKQIRIIFSVAADQGSCEIFVIGARRDNKVYKLAAERLAKLDE